MRLFTAVLPDDNVKDALTDALSELQSISRGGSFTAPANIHLTLAFIGENKNPRGIATVLRDISHPVFNVRLSNMGFFRRKDGLVCWAGIEHSDPLHSLYSKIKDALASIDVHIEDRPYAPHITLGRRIDADGDSVERIDLAPVSMPVSCFSLMQSEVTNGRLIYHELQCFPLL